MSDFNIQAKNDYVIAKSTQEGSDKPYEVVDSSQQNQYLEIVSVGDNVQSCKVGDKIIPYGSQFQAFQYKEVTYVVLTDEQVLGVFN